MSVWGAKSSQGLHHWIKIMSSLDQHECEWVGLFISQITLLVFSFLWLSICQTWCLDFKKNLNASQHVGIFVEFKESFFYLFFLQYNWCKVKDFSMRSDRVWLALWASLKWPLEELQFLTLVPWFWQTSSSRLSCLTEMVCFSVMCTVFILRQITATVVSRHFIL